MQDFVALQWVSAEIGETADQLGKELLAFADNLSDQTRLRHALTLAHQMHATLRLLAIASAEQFAREIEEVVQALLHGRVLASEANLQLLLAASLQLPGYLRRIANERRELPFDLHATLNELRVARGEAELPLPVIDRSIDVSELALGAGPDAEAAGEEEVQLLRKARQRLQAELLGLLKGDPPRERLHAMGRVFALLAQHLRPGGQRPFWQACGGLCDAVIAGGIVFDDRIRATLRDIDNELRASIALESRFYTRAPSDVLYRQLLEIIASSRPATSTLAEIQRRHRLIPDRPGDAPRALVDLGATDAAVGAIAGDLAHVLEQLETTDGDAATVGKLLHSVEPELRRVSALLAGLGYREEHEVLLPQLERIAAGLGGAGAEFEDRLTAITTALLEVDQRLAARSIRAGGQDAQQAEARQHPLARALATVCREVQGGIEQTKQAISDYANSERELPLLGGSPQRLHAMAGALRLAGLGAAAYVLADCETYMGAVLDGRRQPPEGIEVDAFADALSSVEYFIERLLIDRVPAELILVRAREAMRRLALGEALEPPPEPLRSIVARAAPGIEELAAELEELAAAEPAPGVIVELPPAEPTLKEPQIAAAEPEAIVLEVALEPELAQTAPETEPAIEPEAAAESELAAMEFDLSAPAEAEVPVAEVVPVAEELEASTIEFELVAVPEAEAPSLEPAPELALPELVETTAEPPDPEIVEIFVEEASEVLQTIATHFPLWRAMPAPGAALTELRRAFHTLKGSGRMVGADVIGELAWAIEDLLNRVLERTVAAGPDAVAVVEQATALMPGLVEAFAGNRRIHDPRIARVQEAARALALGLPSSREEPAPAATPEPVAPAPAAEPEPSEPEQLLAPEPELADFTGALEQVPDELQPLQELESPELQAAQEFEAPALPEPVELSLSEPVAELEPAMEFELALQQPADAVPAEQPGEPEPVVELEALPEPEFELEFEPAPEAEPAPVLAAANIAATPAEVEEPLDPEIVEIFVEEAAEVLDTVATQFPLWRATPVPGNPLTEVRRAFHTLKGSGRMVGAGVIGELAWSIENLLNRVIDRTVAASPDVLEAVERARTLMPGLVAAFASRTAADMESVLRVQEAATALARGLSVRWEPEQAAVEAAPVAPLEEVAPAEPEFVPELIEPEPLAEQAPPESFIAAVEDQLPEALQPAAEAEAPLEEWLPELEPEEIAAAAADLPAPQPSHEQRLRQIFGEEAADHLRTVRAALEGTASPEALRRSLHTLRGSAFAGGVAALGEALVPADDLAKHAGAAGLRIDGAEGALLNSLCALLEALIASGMNIEPATAEQCAALQAEGERCLRARTEPAAAGAPATEPRMARFLEEALETLFHCGTLLDAWRAEGPDSVARAALLSELQGIERKAEQLDVAAIHKLARALTGALAGATPAESTLQDTAKQALDSCLDALDRLVAGQAPLVPEALLTALHEMAAAPRAPEPLRVAPAREETLRVRVARDLQQAEQELLGIFLEEAEELMASIDEDIDAWRHDRSDRGPFENLQRALHTLKGGARMAGLRYLGELSHNFETFLISQGVQFGHFDDAFFVRVADFHEQLASTMDLVRERPALPAGEPEALEPAPLVEVEAPVEAEAPAEAAPPIEIAASVEAPPIEPSAPIEEAALPAAAAEIIALPEPVATPAQAAADAGALRRLVALDLQGTEAELLGIFLEEADELMASIDGGIHAWRGNRADRAPYDRLQRDLHTLKGGARMAGLKTLGDIAHDFETMLIGSGSRVGAPDDGFFARVADFHEQLARMIDLVKEHPVVEEAPPEAPLEAPAPPVAAPPAEIVQPIAPAAVAPKAPEPPRVEIPLPVAPSRPVAPPGSVTVVAAARPPAPAAAQAAPAETKDEVVRVSAQLLEDLVNLAGETSISRGRVEEQVSELSHLFEDMQATIERLQGQVRRLDIATEAQIHFRRERADEGTEGFDPLEMDRYSQLQQLSRSLVESASDVLDIKRTLAEKTRDLETVLIQQSRINSQLQEGLMRSRMVPFSSILPRIRRVVRQVAQELDKSVELELGNMAGELDRGILERVVAPLEHMLRNAVDHGIESKEKRKAAGKPATGHILIEIARDGGDVLISISDDGAGVNLEAVRAKALERGLMDAGSMLSDHEVIQFILHSGFSTATKVTQISGRGVGMDVVGSEIRQMGGSLEIHSARGQGSRFTIRLPFTVSVSRALLVTAGNEILALPLNTVEGVVRMGTDELARYTGEQAEPFQYAGQSYAVAFLGTLLYPGEQRDTGRRADKVPVVLVRGGGQSLAIEVEGLLGANDIVVKGLGPQFGAVPGLSGATVLGDGSVVLIIDVPAMLRADALRGAQAGVEGKRAAAKTGQATRAPLIMVCDDSVTVRKVTTRFLEREGMRVVTAKDGADAMAQLQEQVPDLMLLDIEMPHMDGFEVVSKVRLSETLRHLPIIMITSRTGEKHRERALSLGANMYLGKPYQESVLIEHINALLKRTSG